MKSWIGSGLNQPSDHFVLWSNYWILQRFCHNDFWLQFYQIPRDSLPGCSSEHFFACHNYFRPLFCPYAFRSDPLSNAWIGSLVFEFGSEMVRAEVTWKGSWITASFPVAGSVEFCFIRLTQTKGADSLVIHAFEFFGTLLEWREWTSKSFFSDSDSIWL
jgi:hypothetical protein